MEIGLPQPSQVQSGSDSTALNPMFATLLMQKGGRVYDEEDRLCVLNELTAVDCFTEWSEFYTKYNFTKSYSNVNRFRTGTMPIVIADYTLYNSLVIAAPEIAGMWSMYPIPGEKRADGTIGRETCPSQSACMIFANTRDADASWEFGGPLKGRRSSTGASWKRYRARPPAGPRQTSRRLSGSAGRATPLQP